ncbi:helix-turn-helix domain-containing protein [Paenibacillus sp. JMULE4]|uniref:ABC transporter substrate-binding protein n=1 Tax=Paenibacillus sp. JMULE4 TaxID=2518342 RepID=UPI0015762D27|nr:AraC family transcriptional regulator [Paenibacillus sp. JMULE4]NTZ17567.1 helix-turn-helix domain-containing protein [Paenibacillus sp. JMULE4]
MLFQYHTLLWNHAALRVQDVRHAILQPGESLRAYQLPASAFLYTVRGKAHVLIDENEYAVDRCYVCHAGKGAFLDIAQVVEAFEYYLVFYTAVLTTPYCQKLVHRHQTSNPFQVQYGFAPQFPTPLFLGIEQMNRQWQQIGTLEQFHVKALFHQFVYELLHQLQEQGGETTQPNLVAQAMRYIEGRYAEPITLNSLAAVLDCNARQLQRLFKARLHVGPIEYLIQVRLDKAKALLQQTNVPLKQIAEAVGYTDSYYFSRMFKKYMGVSPSLFKERAWQRNDRRHNPSRLSQFPIVARRLRRYSDIGDDENHYQYKNEGALHMYRSSKASLAISLMLSLVLLLGACSGTSGGGGASPTNSVNVQPAVTRGEADNANTAGKTAESTQRSIQHLKGELVLEQKPEKIVVLDYQYIDQLLALGEQPIGSVIATSDSSVFPEYLTDKLDDVKVLGTKEEPNLEAIIEAAPDLIICTEFQEKVYEKLIKIAPTLMFDRNEDWRTMLLKFGQIVAKEQEAQKVLEGYDHKIADLKAALADKLNGQTVALIRPRDNMIRLHTTGHRTAEILYRDLGLSAPKMAVNNEQTSLPISLEVMPELNADHLFVLKDDSNTELTDEFQKTSVWKGLNAVQANQVYTVNTTMWIGYYGPIAINLVVDEIAEALL